MGGPGRLRQLRPKEWWHLQGEDGESWRGMKSPRGAERPAAPQQYGDAKAEFVGNEQPGPCGQGGGLPRHR
eukprot:4056656-Amphidinium_carterae.1